MVRPKAVTLPWIKTILCGLCGLCVVTSFLLISQGEDRIDPAGAMRRESARRPPRRPSAARTVQPAIHGSCGWMPYSCDDDEAPEADRRRDADGQADGQQQQHFAHHQPDDDAALRAEREPDAQLLFGAARRRTPSRRRDRSTRAAWPAGRSPADSSAISRSVSSVSSSCPRPSSSRRSASTASSCFTSLRDHAVGGRRWRRWCARRTPRCSCPSSARTPAGARLRADPS